MNFLKIILIGILVVFLAFTGLALVGMAFTLFKSLFWLICDRAGRDGAVEDLRPKRRQAGRGCKTPEQVTEYGADVGRVQAKAGGSVEKRL